MRQGFDTDRSVTSGGTGQKEDREEVLEKERKQEEKARGRKEEKSSVC